MWVMVVSEEMCWELCDRRVCYEEMILGEATTTREKCTIRCEQIIRGKRIFSQPLDAIRPRLAGVHASVARHQQVHALGRVWAKVEEPAEELVMA